MSAALLEEYFRSQSDARSVGSGGGSSDIDTSELKQLVEKWSDVDSNIKRMSRNMSSWKKTKRELEEKIIKFMKDNDFEKLNTKQALIECKTQVQKKKLPKSVVKEKLSELVIDSDIRNQIMDIVFKSEDAQEKTKLKRIVF